MDTRKALVQSRKQPVQHIEALWESIYKYKVKTDTLSSILAFYLHHRVYPPPVQRAFDTLLIAFTDLKVPKKLRNLLFQTVEEMCHWLSPSCITDTVRLSTSPSIVSELLPCFLINTDIPRPEAVVYERLLSSLTSPGLSQDDRCKMLGFLMNTLPADLCPVLNKQLIVWLSYCRTPQTTGSLFRSVDVTEVDGSPCIGMCTALTLVLNVTDLQMLSLAAFSNIRRYLHRTRACVEDSLVNTVFSCCSTVLAQAAKKPSSQQDRQLTSELLEEVLLIVKTVQVIDESWAGRCQLMVRNIQLLAEQLRATTVLLSVWEYQLDQGEDSALTERMLGSVISSDFSQGPVSQRMTEVMVTHGLLLAPALALYTPNLLKLVATHPSALVEEFLDLVQYLACNEDLLVEVLHCLLDLPTLSVSICIHQTALLVMAGFKVPALVSVKQLVEAEHKAVYSHMMRSTLQAGQTDDLLKLYPSYWQAVRPLLALGLVQVCCQVVPLLLETFLASVSSRPEANTVLLPALLSRVPLLCPVPSFQKAVFELLPQYISEACSSQPQLLEDRCVSQFLSVTNHCLLCPQLFVTLVTAVGEHVRTEQAVVNHFDTLDALLREILMDKTSQDERLVTALCSTLAKLASRYVSLIPRAVAAFEKLGQLLQSCKEEEKEVLFQHAKELIRLLKNPRVAGVVLSPSSKEDVATAALLRLIQLIVQSVMEKWQGKVAVVTGASSGIGEATVRALVSQGMLVVGLARRQERITQVAEELLKEKAPGKLYGLKVDLRKEEDILAAFVWVDSELGGADVLVNNAGIMTSSYLSEGHTENWRAMLEVNVLAVAICTREFLKYAEKRNVNTGHIFLINSIAGHTIQYAKINMYTSSKYAVTALGMSLRRELAEKNSTIKVTSISPGPVATEIFGGTEFDETSKTIPILQSEDVAKVILNALSASPVTQICEVIMTPIPTVLGMY